MPTVPGACSTTSRRLQANSTCVASPCPVTSPCSLWGDSLIFGAVASDTSNTGLIALRQRGATSNTGDANGVNVPVAGGTGTES